MTFLRPDAVVTSLASIDLETLWHKGKRGIILDLDNTITPWRQDTLTVEAEDLIAKARSMSYKIHLLSNASGKRTKRVALQIDVGYTAPGFKPFQGGYNRALKQLALSAEQVIAIGDQIFTDIWGGNRAGCYTILVTPVERTEFIGTKFMRLLELIIGR